MQVEQGSRTRLEPKSTGIEVDEDTLVSRSWGVGTRSSFGPQLNVKYNNFWVIIKGVLLRHYIEEIRQSVL